MPKPPPKGITSWCRACEKDFTSDNSFAKHRIGVHEYTYQEGLNMEPQRLDGRRCMETDEMLSAGWTQNERGKWTRPISEDEKERLRALGGKS